MKSPLISDSLRAFLRALPERERYGPAELLVPELRIAQDPSLGLEIYDAPIGWQNPEARLAIIGVTPGFTQMEIVVREVRRHLSLGASDDEACRQAKYVASFAGSMRVNLVRMLDELELPPLLGINSTADLFDSASHLLHTTSAVRHPVFRHGENYTGSRPRLVQAPVLLRYAREDLAPELSSLRGAVYVPLGKSVAELLRLLETEGVIPSGRTLFGLPHPSAANGHRARQFTEARERLREELAGILRSN